MSSLMSSARTALPRIIAGISVNTQIFSLKGAPGSLTKGCRALVVAGSSRKLFTTAVLATKKTVNITFIDRDGDKRTVKANEGETLLDVAKDNDIDLEGACEGTLACSTCHLIFDPEQYEKIGLEPPSEEELDMLDLAYGLTDTSRLGCQIEVSSEMEGLTLTVPSGTSDARSA